MPTITYVEPDGVTRHTIDVIVGKSLMRAAVSNGIEGIVAECGGSCMCATCHVYVTPEQLATTPPMTPDEDAMLDSTAAERKPNSRLSCQLVVGAAMDGLVVHLPETQT